MLPMRLRAPLKGALRATITLSAVAAVAGVVAMPVFPLVNVAAAWYGYGGNAQHTGISKYPIAGMGAVKWSVPVDEDISASSSGDAVLIHYASPCITGINPDGSGNTVVIAVHNNIGGQHDSWRVQGMDGSHGGALKWSYDTDFSAPVLMPSDWTSVYPLAMTGTNTVVAAGGGGTVLVISNPDADGPVTPTRFCFYTSTADYLANASVYKNIKICTPITGDQKGNFYFGYFVTDPTGIPSSILQRIGTGGIVKYNTSGRYSFRTAGSLVPGMIRPAINNAPALSNDLRSVYIGLRKPGTSTAWLVKLNATDPGPNNPSPSLNTLGLQAKVRAVDPYTGADAQMIQESSASPMVAPDGHVFMGVFGSSWRESHGWMLQYDKDLNQLDASGKRYPVGGFGWDDTASIVPASAVPSYTGAASYLILSKYNNYHVGTGDGRNHLAVLDPTASGSTDRQSGIPVMTEIKLVTGVSCDAEYYACTATTDTSDPSVPVREWCINAAAVDPANKCAVVNSEDGHAYKWDFVTNTLQQSTYLQPATGEAYTCTVVGPDGTSYAINNGVLHAIGPVSGP